MAKVRVKKSVRRAPVAPPPQAAPMASPMAAQGGPGTMMKKGGKLKTRKGKK